MAADASLIRASLERHDLAVARRRAALARLTGLSGTDLLALQHVLRAGELTPGVLSDRLQLSTSGTFSVIERLLAAGYAERRVDERNRRRVLLIASERGRSLAASPLTPLSTQAEQLTRELTTDEVACIESFLSRLADRSERDAGIAVREAEAASRAAAELPSPILWG